MKNITLGKTNIEVTELVFGALPIGPIQKNLPVEQGAAAIASALKSGVNFVDTAKSYRTYPQVRMAMEQTGIRPTLSSRSNASDYDQMVEDIEEALTALNVPYIDIFMLHAARAEASVFEERKGALRAILDYKEKGKIKASGISTHDVSVAKLGADLKEIDVVFPIINKKGLGILGGSREDMEASIYHVLEREKGLMFMKVLGGGSMITDYLASLQYVRGLSGGKAAIVMGMLYDSEVAMNVKYFNGEDVAAEVANLKENSKRFHVIKALCVNCGTCIPHCHSSAISEVDGFAYIDTTKCLTCGYCVNACPQFAIRML